MSKAPTWQWQVSVTVFHDPGFGHRITVEQIWKGRNNALTQSLGSWKGLGIPEQVLNEARARIDSIVTDHLVTRYGVAGELPLKWSGEPDPF